MTCSQKKIAFVGQSPISQMPAAWEPHLSFFQLWNLGLLQIKDHCFFFFTNKQPLTLQENLKDRGALDLSHFSPTLLSSFLNLSMHKQHVAQDDNEHCQWDGKMLAIVVCMLSCAPLFVTPWTVVHQAPLSMGFSRQECWSGFLGPSPGDLLIQGIKPRSHISCIIRWVPYH